MANPEKLNAPQVSPEEKVISEARENAEDLKEELPITPEQAKEVWEFFEWFMDELDKATKPLAYMKTMIEAWINDAKERWYLKRWETEQEKLRDLIKKVMENPEAKNLIYKDERDGNYRINTDCIFNLINGLDKKDRKFVKKTLKAMMKTHEKIVQEEASSKEEKKIEKKISKNIRKEILKKIK